MNEDNDWDYDVEGDAVEVSVVCVRREEVLQALNEMKAGGKKLDLQMFHCS